MQLFQISKSRLKGIDEEITHLTGVSRALLEPLKAGVAKELTIWAGDDLGLQMS